MLEANPTYVFTALEESNYATGLSKRRNNEVDTSTEDTMDYNYKHEANYTLPEGRRGERKSLVDGIRPRCLLKGYSLESSGFEDEADTCQSSPERGFACAETGKNKLIVGRVEARIDKPILEKSLSSVSGASQAISRDSLERRSSLDKDEVGSYRTEQPEQCNASCNASNCSEGRPRYSTPIDLERQKNYLDFIVNQITALRKELHDQEERMKCYIDDGMERVSFVTLAWFCLSIICCYWEGFC